MKEIIVFTDFLNNKIAYTPGIDTLRELNRQSCYLILSKKNDGNWTEDNSFSGRYFKTADEAWSVITEHVKEYGEKAKKMGKDIGYHLDTDI